MEGPKPTGETKKSLGEFEVSDVYRKTNINTAQLPGESNIKSPTIGSFTSVSAALYKNAQLSTESYKTYQSEKK